MPHSSPHTMRQPPINVESNASRFRTSNTQSAERKKLQKKRWFRKAQKWRTGAEGRISLLKRRHGLNRCHYKGQRGMKRWVGLGVIGVIGDNLINIGRAMAASAKG